ncbi:hypothetical protein C1645_877404 [Glomus cerebriforme]|uniref:TLC domain-containing protein n=1 Tax=Glomus cerebriforme TaxID=658196 RepID=A0A397SRU4_9GLOM|nr:hypothetical protein C1645_877404 [Glomus cerebriforme]
MSSYKSSFFPFQNPFTIPNATLLISSFIFSSALLLTIYFFFSRNNFLKNKRQKAWILTFITSIIMTLGSIPFLYQLIFNANWNVNDLPNESNLSIILVGFFMTYCIIDILLGKFFYENEISNVTNMKGYLHHLVYLVVSSFVIYKQRTEIFCLMSIFEVSTLVLATEKINDKSFKQDILYAATFVSTRLLFHAIMIYLYFNYHQSKSTWLILSFLYPLHCYWFYRFVKQQVYARNQQRKRSLYNKMFYNDKELEEALNRSQTKRYDSEKDENDYFVEEKKRQKVLLFTLIC